jgi:hypothetical protein
MIHNAANGLVGQTLVQLAAARGIKVISVVRHKVSFLCSLDSCGMIEELPWVGVSRFSALRGAMRNDTCQTISHEDRILDS